MADLSVVGPDDWPAWRELRLLALEESPDAFGSRLVDWQGPRDHEEHWRDRLTSVPFNVMAFEGGTPVGMASGVPDDEAVELISMYVRPQDRGTGVAERLVGAVAAWADERGTASVVLSVRTSNERAKAFYRRLGFVEVGPAEAQPGEPPEVVMRREPTVIS